MGVHSFFLALNTNNHGRDEITIEIQGRQDEDDERWVIEMYRLWRQRDGTWHVVWVLNKARVTPAPAEDETGSTDEIDDIEW